MKLLDTAFRFARTHEFQQNFRHCAIVARGAKVLGVGFNRYGWSSKQAGKYRTSLMDDGVCTVHAEVDALLKVASRDDIAGSTVYVVRINRQNELAMSKPCAMCEAILREHNVKRVFFSVSADENAYGVLNLR